MTRPKRKTKDISADSRPDDEGRAFDRNHVGCCFIATEKPAAERETLFARLTSQGGIKNLDPHAPELYSP
jgi:hypothetical protein